MNIRMISALVVKDVMLYFRNRFFALITILALVAYAAVYFLMPSTVNETISLGLYAQTLPPVLKTQLEAEGVAIQSFDSEAALKDAVTRGDLQFGFSLTNDALQKLAAGQNARIDAFFNSDTPQEVKDAFSALLKGLAYELGGQSLNVEVSEVVLGPDLAGMQIPPRDRLRPLFAVFVVTMETLGLASLITSEIEGGTLRALLITPLRVEGLFVGKGVMGVGLAFVQAVFLLAVVGGLSRDPLLVLTTVLLGSLLVTGIAFMLASVARDMLGVIGWGILVIVLLSIPAFGVILPGTVTDWVKAIPSYYFVDTIYRANSFGEGWPDLWPNLLVLLAAAAVIFGLGTVVLRRKLT